MFLRTLYEKLLDGTAFLCFADGDDDSGTGGSGGGDGGEEKKPDAGGDAKPNKGDGLVNLKPADKSDAEGVGDKPEGEEKTGDGDETPKGLILKDQPKWLADNFYDKDTGEVKVEALAKSQHDLREKMSKGSDVPKTSDEYTLEVTDDALKAVENTLYMGGEKDKDPLVMWFREAAHENGIGQEVAGKMFNGFLDQVSKLMPEPIDIAAETKKLGPHGDAMRAGVETLLQTMFDKGVVSWEQSQRMTGWLKTAEDMQAFQKLREWYGVPGVPEVTGSPAGAASADELKAEMAKVMELSDKGDPTAQAKYDALQVKYEALYGTDPAGTSRANA